MLRVETDDGIRLVVEARGAPRSPLVLFLNSIGCDRTLWDLQFEALEGGYRCLAFDARGHGQSDVPPGDYTIERLGRDALAVLDAVDVASAHLCGLSLGGLVAQWLAVHAPRRVASLTLANTASRIGSYDSWEARRLRVLEAGLGSIAGMAIERFFSAAFRTDHPQFVEDYRTRFARGAAVGYAGCCAALRDADLTPELARIAAPTLVIGGAFDVSTPPAEAEALAAGIRGARLRLLSAGHLSNREQPAAFTAALQGHIATEQAGRS